MTIKGRTVLIATSFAILVGSVAALIVSLAIDFSISKAVSWAVVALFSTFWFVAGYRKLQADRAREKAADSERITD